MNEDLVGRYDVGTEAQAVLTECDGNNGPDYLKFRNQLFDLNLSCGELENSLNCLDNIFEK